MSSSTKLLFASITMLIAAAAVTVALAMGGSTHRPQTSSVWHVGSAWKLVVKKNGDLVAPAGDGSGGYSDTWTMRLVAAPATANGYWVVSAKLTGAEGPFARGFSLYYRRVATNPDAFQLEAIGLGTTAPQPFSRAEPLLGAGFPLQQRIVGAPTKSPVHPTGVPGLPPAISLGAADSGGYAGPAGSSTKSMPPRPLTLPAGTRVVGPSALAHAEGH